MQPSAFPCPCHFCKPTRPPSALTVFFFPFYSSASRCNTSASTRQRGCPHARARATSASQHVHHPHQQSKVFFLSFSFLLICIHMQRIRVHTPMWPSACPCPCMPIPVPSVSYLFFFFFSPLIRVCTHTQRICMPTHSSTRSHTMHIQARTHAQVYPQHPSTFFLCFFFTLICVRMQCICTPM